MEYNTDPEVIVYGSESCTSCARTCLFLRSKGIAHKYVDVMTDPEGFALVKANGSQMPLVLSPIGPWSGMRPDKVIDLAKHYSQDPSDDGPDESSDIEPGPPAASGTEVKVSA